MIKKKMIQYRYTTSVLPLHGKEIEEKSAISITEACQKYCKLNDMHMKLKTRESSKDFWCKVLL